MSNPSRDNPRAGGEGYSGRQKAFVRDRNDPDKLGRVRVQAPGVMGEENTENSWLGWAEVSSGYWGTSDADVDAGGVCIPELDSPVWVEFQEQNPDFPIVVGPWVAGEGGSDSGLPKLAKGQADPDTAGIDRVADGITVPKSAAAPAYPDNRVVKTRDGFVVELDSTAGGKRARIRHPSGTFAEITNPGNLVKQVVGDLLVWIGGSVKYRAVGNIMLSAGMRVYLAGSEGSAINKVAHEGTKGVPHVHTVNPTGLVVTVAALGVPTPVLGTATVSATVVDLNPATCTDRVKVVP